MDLESPPSSSSWSQPVILSEDSGLHITSGSCFSGSRSEQKCFGFEVSVQIFLKMLLLKLTSQDSDCEEKSLSQDDSFDAMSDIMCGEHYNTLKKGPNWTETQTTASPIEPPLEFQDRPKTPSPVIDFFCDRLTHQILKRVMRDFRDRCCFGPLRLTVQLYSSS